MNDLTVTLPQGPSAELLALVTDTAEFARASRADSTITRYESCWTNFLRFCTTHALEALPADPRTVVVFLTSLAKDGKALSTVQGHLAALKYVHERNNLTLDTTSPRITEVMAGIRRKIGSAQEGSDALLPEDLRTLVAQCGTDLAGIRDRAVILLGFAGAFRRSELVSLTMDDIEAVAEGIVIHLRRSKTDQDGAGAEIAIPYAIDPAICPVGALTAWFSAAGITSGPIFRRVRRGGIVGTEALSDGGVYRIVTGLVDTAGLGGKITPHSLRSGFCTAALLNGAQLTRVSSHLRHKSVNTTAKYDRVADRFRNHAGKGLL